MRFFTYLVLFSIYSNMVFAQQKPYWVCALGKNVLINDFIENEEGTNIIAVGSIKEQGTLKGFLAKIDVNTGKVVKTNTYSYLGDAELKSIAPYGDGTYYAVGYVKSNENKKQGWIARLDENFEEMKNNRGILGEKGDDYFEKIALYNGKGFILGKKENSAEGSWWYYTIRKHKPIEIAGDWGDRRFKDIKMFSNYKKEIWVVGNSTGINDNNIAHLVLMDFNGVPSKTINITDRKNFESTFESASMTPSGGVLLSGKTYAYFDEKKGKRLLNQAGDRETLLNIFPKYHEDSTQANFINTNVLSTTNTDNGVLVCATYNNAMPYLFLRSERAKTDTFKLFFLDNNGREVSHIVLDFPKDLKDANFIKMQCRSYGKHNTIIAANLETKSGNYPVFYNYEIPAAQKSALVGKGVGDNLSIASVEIETENEDKCVLPEQTASLRISIKNNGNSDSDNEGVLKIEANNLKSGITLLNTQRTLGFIGQNDEKTYSFGIKTSSECKSGTSPLKIILDYKGKSISRNFDLCSNKTSVLSKNKVFFDEKKPRLDRTSNPMYEVVIKTETTNRIQQTSKNLYNNGKKLPDGKAPLKTTDNNPIQGFYYNTITTSIKLDTANGGKNVIYAKVGDDYSDTIVVYYKKEINLFVLSIGVPDKFIRTLHYTTNDAKDFAAKAKKQKGNGFFTEVDVEILADSAKTTAEAIKKGFNTLLHKFKNGIIKEDDYVMVLISSHGDIVDDKFILLPSNYTKEDELSLGVRYEELLRNYLSKIPCKRFVFIDACHSGGKGVNVNPSLASQIEVANNALPELVQFSSCSKKQQSYEYEKGENGVFTEVFLEAIDGKADINNNGFISIGEMKNYLSERSKTLLPSGLQTPFCDFGKQQEDLPLFKYK